MKPMDGVQYVTNTRGRRTAVLIDLDKHKDLWEDFCDCVIARSRQTEPKESLEMVKKRLKLRRKSDA